MNMLAKVRAAGIRAELFPDAAKMKKQMSYANAKNILFVAIIGRKRNERRQSHAEEYGNGRATSCFDRRTDCRDSIKAFPANEGSLIDGIQSLQSFYIPQRTCYFLSVRERK